jgi:hypothetical protein
MDSAAERQKSQPRTRQGSLIHCFTKLWNVGLIPSAVQLVTGQISTKDYTWVANQPQFAPLIKTSAFVGTNVLPCPTARIWMPLSRTIAVMKRCERRSQYS